MTDENPSSRGKSNHKDSHNFGGTQFSLLQKFLEVSEPSFKKVLTAFVAPVTTP